MHLLPCSALAFNVTKFAGVTSYRVYSPAPPPERPTSIAQTQNVDTECTECTYTMQ